MALPNYVKFYRGTPAAFNKLTSKDNNTLYFIAENGATKGQLYLGNKLISGSDASDINLGDLGNVNLEDAINNDILSYDSASGEWVATSLETLLAQIPSLGESAIYEGVTGEGENHMAAIARLVGANVPKKGDIAIIKDFIAKNPKDSEDKYQYTSYVYNGSAWTAMDGNYNAENVYFDEDLLTTSKVGNITTLTNGQATISAAGKNLKEVFETIFVKESNPSVTQPSVTVTLDNAGAYEVGYEFTPVYSAKLNAGSYTYGPATGITAKTWSVTDSNSGSSTNSSGSFAKFTVTDTTNYKVSATATYDAGKTPVTNLGNSVSSLAIASGSKTGTSSAVTPYRNTFYGAINAKSNVDSALIRSLTKSGKALANGNTFDVDVNVGALRVVIAYPATLNDLTSIQDNNDSMANIISSFTKTTVKVEGANGATAIDYKVYYIDFANAYDAANKFTVTI